MRTNLSLLFLVIAISAFAQNTKGRLLPVASDGLYKIPIPAEIRSYSKKDLSDFRILDAKNREVPYSKLVRSYADDRVCHEFIGFKIVSKNAVEKKNTVLVVENPLTQITDVSLKIANIEVTKKFSLSGSDDGKNWYGIINQKTFTDVRSSVSFADYLTIAMPITSYKFLKFDFDDTKTLPVNVIEVGVNKSRPCPFSVIWDTIKNAKIDMKQLADEKKTLIHVSFSQPQDINRIAIAVNRPKTFERSVRIYAIGKQKMRRKTVDVEQTLGTFTMFPDVIDHNFHVFSNDFYIEIANRDSPPLELSKIAFVQQREYIAAELLKGESYTISTGDAKKIAPDYDAPRSIDISNHIADMPQTAIVSIAHTSHPDIQSATSQIPFWQQSWFLWTCIVVATIGVGFFTWSLVRDMK